MGKQTSHTKKNQSIRPAVIFIVLFAVIGVILLVLTKAATLNNMFEVESGSVSGNAAVVAGDNSASGNASVKFSATTMPPMGNMPMVNASSIPGQGPYSWTQPYIKAQDSPYQPGDGTGAFRITSRYSHASYADPIAYPGGASPHLHIFYGNKCVTATMTDPLSCNATTSDGGTLNKTAYWVPAMIDRAGNVVYPGDMQVYYKRGYEGPSNEDIKIMPAGLKMLAGNPKATSGEGGGQNDRAVNYDCNNSDGTSFNHIPSNAEANAAGGSCGPGTQFVMTIQFPQCWDGRNLDSADHKSHMAYANGGPCSGSHPYAIPDITERVFYTVPNGGIPDGWRLSSDNYPYNGSNAGYSGHGDWWNGWDTGTMQSVVSNCLNPGRDCSMDILGNGQQLDFGPH